MKTTTTGTPPKENGDLRTAIVDVLLNDDAVMQTIINAVSDALVSKLLTSKDFMATLADKLLSHVAPDTVKQSVYEASAMDNSRTYASVTTMEWRASCLPSTATTRRSPTRWTPWSSTADGIACCSMAYRRPTPTTLPRVSFRSERESWTWTLAETLSTEATALVSDTSVRPASTSPGRSL